MASYLLGLDVGTSSAHCVLSDPSGRPLHTTSAPMEYFTPQDCPSLARGFNPEMLFALLGRLVTEAMKKGRAHPKEIAGIGITSQRQGVVFLDNKGKELYAGPNLDLRAMFEGAAIDEQLGDEVYKVTGHLPSLLFAPARLRWFQEHQPHVHSRVSSILTIGGWLAYRITGNRVSEHVLTGEAGLLDVVDREPCRLLMDQVGVSCSLLPSMAIAGTEMGVLSGRTAAQWGLTPRIPVTLAGPDTQCGLLGMGVTQEGETGVVLGWSGCVQMVTQRPCHDQERRTWVGCYSLPDRWVAESNLGDTGNSFRWLKELVLGDHSGYEEVERLAKEVEPGADGVVAFLGPGAQGMSRTGLGLGGILFPTPLSFQEVVPGQLFRGALENIAYAIRSNCQLLEQVTGMGVGAIHLGGGMASSRLLAHILANVLGKEVYRTLPSQVSSRGACMAAAVMTGHFTSLEEASRSLLDSQEIISPDASTSAEYEEQYQKWLKLHQTLEIQ